MNTILIGLFGFLGVILRYQIGQFFKAPHPILNPTFFVNILGCFMIGICFHYLKSGSSHKVLVSSIIIGFCGGLTTFSSLALDTFKFITTNQIQMALAYILISITFGLLFLFIGYKLVS